MSPYIPGILQPLAGSWQDRVKSARKAEKRAAKKAAKAAATADAPDEAGPSAGLPPGWQAMVDKSSGDVYYGNLSTKVGACRGGNGSQEGQHSFPGFVPACG